MSWGVPRKHFLRFLAGFAAHLTQTTTFLYVETLLAEISSSDKNWPLGNRLAFGEGCYGPQNIFPIRKLKKKKKCHLVNERRRISAKEMITQGCLCAGRPCVQLMLHSENWCGTWH